MIINFKTDIIMRKLLLIRWCALLVCLVSAVNAGAYDFQVNGIYYDRTSDGSTEVEVTYQANSVWKQFSNIQTLNYDFIEDNIPYRIMNAAEHTVAVTYETYGAHSGVVTIPETVTHDDVTYVVTNIESHAFRNCSNLTVINLPVTLQYIGTYAFYNCTSLTSVRIPDNVWYVASWAFQGCTSLASVDLGSGLTEMATLFSPAARR